MQEIIRDGTTREVRVIVAYAEGEDAFCAKCGKVAAIHDRKARKWRHLDPCNHKTIIESEIPRVRCEEHGVLQVKVPWAEKNSRFTMEGERHVCRWLQMASISEVGSMFDLSWDEVVKALLERQKFCADGFAFTAQHASVSARQLQRAFPRLSACVCKECAIKSAALGKPQCQFRLPLVVEEVQR